MRAKEQKTCPGCGAARREFDPFQCSCRKYLCDSGSSTYGDCFEPRKDGSRFCAEHDRRITEYVERHPNA